MRYHSRHRHMGFICLHRLQNNKKSFLVIRWTFSAHNIGPSLLLHPEIYMFYRPILGVYSLSGLAISLSRS